MKTLKIATAICLLCAFCIARAGSPVWLTQLQAPRVEINNLNNVPVRSVVLRHPDICRQYQRQEITGWVLFGAGLGAMAGGGYMIYKGVTRIVNANTNNVENLPSSGVVVSKNDITFVSVGSALAFAGSGLTPSGLAVGITGTVRYSKYCGRSSYLITPAIDNNGLGISAAF